MPDYPIKHAHSRQDSTQKAKESDRSAFRQVMTRTEDTQAKKRRAKKHERIAAHYKLLLMKFLNAIGAPDIAFDYCAGLVAVLGFDESRSIELHDDEFARITLGSTHWLKKEDWKIRLKREIGRRRKQRQRILNWQAKKDAPLLFEFDNSLYQDGKETRRHAKYTLYFIEPLRELAGDVEPGASDEWIDRAVRVRSSEYHERFTGEAHVLKGKQTQSPESEAHRAGTKLGKAMEAAAAAVDELGNLKGEQGALDLFFDEFLTRLPLTDFAFLRIIEKVKALQEKVLSGIPSETIVPPIVLESESKTFLHDIAAELEKYPEPVPASVLQNGSAPIAPKPPSRKIEQPVEDFIASNPAYHQATKSVTEPTAPKTSTLPETGWRDLAITDRQREVLGRGGHFDFSITRGQASDRISEMKASGALCDFLSLADLENYDRRGGRDQGNEKRFCCPECGHDKPLDGDHRSLSANVQTGAYFCHRCEAKGILREFLSDQTSPILPRQFPAPSPQPKAETDDRWRKFVADAKPITGTKGAAYLESRGIPADAAKRAGVRFGTWWKPSDEGDKPEPFAAVIFEIVDREGQMVAAQARAITGDTKRTRGQKLQGVFEAIPGALEAPRVAITEAPIDALALAAAGLFAIAICGKTGPEWLAEHLAGREVFIATDADTDGDKIAKELAKLMRGKSPTKRLRPSGGKDWAEVAKKHGLDSVAAQVAAAVGQAEADEMHDSSLLTDGNEGGSR